MSDLTFRELGLAGNDCCVETGGKVLIDVSLLTGDTVSSLDDVGVFEALAKLLKFGYEAQEEKNETLETGQKMGALSVPSSSVPVLDAGKIVTTTEYSMRLKYSADLDNPTAPLS